MNQRPASFLVVLVLGLFLVITGCAQSPSPVNSAEPVITDASLQVNYTSNETLVAFVDSAVAQVNTHGKEKALSEFNNPNGSFIRGELYIYAYDFNGTTLAHPVNPEAVGKIRTGANGIFVKEMSAGVRNGSGFYRLVYINPAHNRTLESKLAYGVKVDDDWWLGSGIYTGPAEPAG